MAPGIVTASAECDRDGGMARIAQRGGAGRGRGAARPVDRDDVIAARGRNQRKAVAADAGHCRFGEAQDRRTRNGRIHRIATLLENAHRRLRGQRVRRGAEAIRRQNRGSAGGMEIAHVTEPPYHFLGTIGLPQVRHNRGCRENRASCNITSGDKGEIGRGSVSRRDGSKMCAEEACQLDRMDRCRWGKYLGAAHWVGAVTARRRGKLCKATDFLVTRLSGWNGTQKRQFGDAAADDAM